MTSGDTARSVALAISALISSVPINERRDVMNASLRFASGKVEPLMPFTEGIPSESSPEQARWIMNGLGAMLLSLCQAGKDTTAAAILKRADAISKGVPFQGDPHDVSPGQASLTHAMASAALHDPDVANMIAGSPDVVQWMASIESASHPELRYVPILAGGDDNKKKKKPNFFQNLWKAVSAGAPTALNTAATMVSEDQAVESLKDKYLAVGTYKTEEEARQAAEKAVASVPGGIGSGTSWPLSNQDPMIPKVNFVFNPSTGQFMPSVGDSSRIGSSIGASISSSLADTKAALKQSMEQMKVYAAKADEVKQAAKESSLDMARMAWCTAALEAPAATAELMARVDPIFGSPRSLMDTVFKLIPAAKSSGDLTLMSALSQSIRSSIQSGEVPSSITALLGDPLAVDHDLIGSEIDVDREPIDQIQEEMRYEHT